MIRVLFVISNLNIQGPIKQILYLCKYLDKSIIEPVIVTTAQKTFENSMHKKFEEIGVQVLDLKLSKIKSIFISNRKIQPIIDKNKIDIILSFGFRSDMISYKLKKVHRVTMVRNTLIFNYQMIYGRLLGSILGYLNLFFIKKYELVIACSNSVAEYLKTLNLKSSVVLNAIDYRAFELKGICDISKDRVRVNNNLPIGRKIFITISSKLSGKNIKFLTSSFSNQVALSSHYLIVAGYVEPEIQNYFHKFENIKFIGNVNTLSTYLRASDFLVSASLHEGMPNVVLESMAVGTPVILSDIASHLEIFEYSPKGVFIFKNNDTNNLIKVINDSLKEDYGLLTSNCLNSIANVFDAKIMANRYHQLFIKLLNH